MAPRWYFVSRDFLGTSTDDDKCVPASGPWPAGSVSSQKIDETYDGDDEHNGPFVTCFVFHAADDDISSPTDACWSHSYYHGGFGIGNRAHHTVWVQRAGQLTHPATREKMTPIGISAKL